MCVPGDESVVFRPEMAGRRTSTERTRSVLPSRVLRVLAIRYMIIGPEFYAESDLRQLVALANRGHEVTFVVARTPGACISLPKVPTFRLESVLLRKVVPVLSLIFFELVALWRALRSIGDYDCLILDVQSVAALLPAFLFRRFGDHSPVLLLRVETNPVETGGPMRSLGLSFLYTLSIKLATIFFDKILFITPMLADLYSAQFHIPEGLIGIWPSSVDTSCFYPKSTPEVDRLRKDLRLSGRLGVLYHGSISKARGIMELVEAFRILNEEEARATLVLLGYGPLRAELRTYVQDNHLQDVVQIPEPVATIAEVADYIAASDVEIVPMPNHPWWRYQNFIKVLETLAMNKPLIVSDIPANRWIIGDAPVALYLKGTSPREIADGVHAFLKGIDNLDPTLGGEIASKFSVEKIAEMIEHEILSKICAL